MGKIRLWFRYQRIGQTSAASEPEIGRYSKRPLATSRRTPSLSSLDWSSSIIQLGGRRDWVCGMIRWAALNGVTTKSPDAQHNISFNEQPRTRIASFSVSVAATNTMPTMDARQESLQGPTRKRTRSTEEDTSDEKASRARVESNPNSQATSASSSSSQQHHRRLYQEQYQQFYAAYEEFYRYGEVHRDSAYEYRQVTLPKILLPAIQKEYKLYPGNEHIHTLKLLNGKSRNERKDCCSCCSLYHYS